MFLDIVFWHWFAFGTLLLIVELLAPGMFFLWMAEAAVVTGIILWLVPSLEFDYQIGVFSVLSVVSTIGARAFVKSHPIVSDKPQLNRRMVQFIGRDFVLDGPIVNGEGRVRIDDSIWKVRGRDCSSGTKVRVVATDGVVLLVEH